MSTMNISRSLAAPSRDRQFASEHASTPLLGAGALILRYGLVLLLLWFGVFKFTPTEAQAIQPLVANSPLLSWLYSILVLRGSSS